MSSIESRAAEVIRRLREIDRDGLSLDRRRAEDALARHFAALGHPSLPIVWAPDAETGWAEARSSWVDERWYVREQTGWLAVASAISSRARITDGIPASPPFRIPAVREAFDLAWTADETRLIRYLDARFDGCLPSSAALSAVLAAGPEGPTWEPLLDAARAGLWIFWVLPDHVVAVRRPRIRCAGDRMHADVGPAVDWSEGCAWWFWHGVRVPRHVVESPETITGREVLREENAEVRRVLLERMGAARFLRSTKASAVQEDAFGSLHVFRPRRGELLVLVRVVNSTPGPDGLRAEHLLRVPPRTRTARAAVAWTFGLGPLEYSPILES